MAFALVFALPAWFVWRKRVSAAFVVLSLFTSVLPDLDVLLARWFPGLIRHHGVTHTVVFVVLVSIVTGLLSAALLTRPIDDWLGWERFDRESMFAFAFLAFLLGGLSHLFADSLSAPDISTPITPFWPFLDWAVGLDVIYYDNPLYNAVFLVAMLAVHAAVAYLAEPVGHRYRFQRRASR